MRYFTLLFFTLFSGVVWAQVQSYALNEGVKNFTVTDIDGAEHTLHDIAAQGKYVFIDFSSTTCGPCQNLMSVFNEFYDKYGCNEGDVYCITIFGAYNITDSDVENFEEYYGGTFNHAPAVSAEGGGQEATNDFNPQSNPTFCVIDPENRIINLGIWPVDGIESFENAFPEGFDPPAMACSTSGVDDWSHKNELEIFPNPVKEGQILNLKNTDHKNYTINVYTALGTLVKSVEVNAHLNRLSLDLNQGLYLLEIKDDDFISTQKLIVD